MRPQPEDDIEPWIIGERGLADALGRLRAAGNDTPAAEIAATEAIWWATALDEWHERRVGKARYRQFRNREEFGRPVGGLRYARHLTAHQLALIPGFVAVGEPAIPFEDRWHPESGELFRAGIQFVEIRWRPFDELPEPDPEHAKNLEPLARSYRDDVAGRPLDEPIADALTFFEATVWAA